MPITLREEAAKQPCQFCGKSAATTEEGRESETLLFGSELFQVAICLHCVAELGEVLLSAIRLRIRDRLRNSAPHRDDLPFELVEAMEKKLAEEHPGQKLMFAGDHPDAVPDELLDAVAMFQSQVYERLQRGVCCQCGQKMDNFIWPPSENWVPPMGWRVLVDPQRHPLAFVCPACRDSSEELRSD